MRFKKGSNIEVLSKSESPSGSWHPAKVVCGNGHIYTIQYEHDTCPSNESTVEKVPRKLIRPYPPSVDLLEDLVRGDVLEVFQNYSWKMVTVCKVLGKNEFLVRLVGFSREFKVSRSDLRVRQSWQDGRWFVIGKNIGNCEALAKPNEQSSRKCKQNLRRIRPRNGFFADRNTMKSPIISLRNRKRGFSYADSEVDQPAKKHSNSFLYNKKAQFIDYDKETLTCSMGSCSSIDSKDLFKSRSYFPKGAIDDECSDAESVFNGDFEKGNIYIDNQVLKVPALRGLEGSEEGKLLRNKNECVGEIRRLELDAYRRTIEALHACGPLSWEQEALVTNLRLSLNISNDQHLIELRLLASSTTSLSLR